MYAESHGLSFKAYRAKPSPLEQKILMYIQLGVICSTCLIFQVVAADIKDSICVENWRPIFTTKPPRIYPSFTLGYNSCAFHIYAFGVCVVAMYACMYVVSDLVLESISKLAAVKKWH